MTPRERTTTSGFSTIVPSGLFMLKSKRGLFAYLNQLNRRTLYGQLFSQ